MALKHDQTMLDGSPITFHKVMDTTVDQITGDGTATLGSWRTYEDFVVQKAPLMRRKYSFSLQGMDSYTAAYETIKVRPEFQGSVDF